MKNRNLFLLAGLLCFQSLAAQIDTFDIGQFILPEVSRKSLVFLGNAGGSVNNQSSTINTGSRVRQNLLATISFNNFDFDRERQLQTFGNVSLSGLFNNAGFDNTGQAVQNQVHNNASALVNRTSRNYYAFNRFYGSQVNISLFNNFTSAEYNGNLRYYENRLQTSISIPLTFGFGRIEPVTDAWHATRILQDFERLGILDHNPTYQEIYNLAETLSDLRYERIFDNRFGRIRRINALDEHLRETALVNDWGSAYFTSLYDIYEFGLQTVRSSGERLTLGLGPEVSLYHFIDGDSNTLNMDYGFLLFGAYTFNYPISQELQLDIEASVAGRYLWGENPFLNSGFSTNPELTISGGFYPNTRTFFTAAISTGGVYGRNLVLNDKFAFYASMQGSIYYFFSRRTALNFNIGFNYAQSAISSAIFPGFGFEGYNFIYNIQLNHALY